MVPKKIYDELVTETWKKASLAESEEEYLAIIQSSEKRYDELLASNTKNKIMKLFNFLLSVLYMWFVVLVVTPLLATYNCICITMRAIWDFVLYGISLPMPPLKDVVKQVRAMHLVIVLLCFAGLTSCSSRYVTYNQLGRVVSVQQVATGKVRVMIAPVDVAKPIPANQLHVGDTINLLSLRRY